MQQHLFAPLLDLSQERVLVGVSGGINSAAVLAFILSELPEAHRPRVLLLYYAHLSEHSPDTFRFVKACVRYARARCPDVHFQMHRASVLSLFEKERFIPHPIVSPCTSRLKVEPMQSWGEQMGATIDLIGYVRSEARRVKRQRERGIEGKGYPIQHMTDAECFALVDREIGFHPAIYDVRDDTGRRVFKHNNCLPCKNMHLYQIEDVAEHYPAYWQRAQQTAAAIGSYWGRKSEYADGCAVCTFD